MADIKNAILEEDLYKKDKFSGINSNLLERLNKYGYTDLKTYFADKKEYMFNQWIPEVIYIDVSTITTELEKAVREGKYGVYISTSDNLYAFHGSNEIDHDLCDELGICVAELYYNGGTIIGSNKDLGIEVVMPVELCFNHIDFMQKFYEIISKHVENVEISGNDILVDNKKVMGSMSRCIGDTFVWAAQVSFGDYNDIISQVCNKKSTKIPSYIDSEKLSKDQLEMEVLKWLQKH